MGPPINSPPRKPHLPPLNFRPNEEDNIPVIIPFRIYTMASNKAVTPIYVNKTAFKTKMDTKKPPYPNNPDPYLE